MHSTAEKLKFFAEFLRSPRDVGSVIPTSARVIARALDQVDWETTDLFVEYGPGMGTFTRPILERLRPDARLIAIDPCASFIGHLRTTIRDPRLTLVEGSAADVEAILAQQAQGRHADYILSGLPFSTLPEGVGPAIMAATARAIRPGGAFIVYQYSHFVLPMLRANFATVDLTKVWLNIPPCDLFVARKA